FAGPASEAYERLTSNDFRTYSVGVQFQVPLSNALARSEITQSRIARTEAELNHRETLSTVTLEVRQSTANLTSARQRIDTTRMARELAEENLRNQEKRHDVGMATTKDLLDFQTRLTTARAAEVQAKIDCMIAVARWRRAQGELLQHYQIVLDRPGRRGRQLGTKPREARLPAGGLGGRSDEDDDRPCRPPRRRPEPCHERGGQAATAGRADGNRPRHAAEQLAAVGSEPLVSARVHRSRMSVTNSSRVWAFFRNTPSIALVTTVEFCFSTPRIRMQRCS